MALVAVVITEEYSDGTPYFVGSWENGEEVMDDLDSFGVSYDYYEVFAS